MEFQIFGPRYTKLFWSCFRCLSAIKEQFFADVLCCSYAYHELDTFQSVKVESRCYVNQTSNWLIFNILCFIYNHRVFKFVCLLAKVILRSCKSLSKAGAQRVNAYDNLELMGTLYGILTKD